MSKSPSTVIAYVGLGSNLGDAINNVKHAIERLGTLPMTSLEKQSSLFRSAPIDADGDDFINAVVQVNTTLPAIDLLRELQRIENEFGRERPHVNAPRTLDLDILLYGQQKLVSTGLVVPHPRLTRRAFTLIPLLQLDPFISIPGSGPAHSFVPDVVNQRITKIAEQENS
jgi:2-amino-4-hydroxy-6-hydroxymethyldihydropteridine diphosphokinase